MLGMGHHALLYKYNFEKKESDLVYFGDIKNAPPQNFNEYFGGKGVDIVGMVRDGFLQKLEKYAGPEIVEHWKNLEKTNNAKFELMKYSGKDTYFRDNNYNPRHYFYTWQYRLKVDKSNRDIFHLPLGNLYLDIKSITANLYEGYFEQ